MNYIRTGLELLATIVDFQDNIIFSVALSHSIFLYVYCKCVVSLICVSLLK